MQLTLSAYSYPINVKNPKGNYDGNTTPMDEEMQFQLDKVCSGQTSKIDKYNSRNQTM